MIDVNYVVRNKIAAIRELYLHSIYDLVYRVPTTCLKRDDKYKHQSMTECCIPEQCVPG
jgi:hypothetical protein